MPLKLPEKFRAMAEMPAQVKTSTVIAVAAIVIALVAVGIALGGRRAN